MQKLREVFSADAESLGERRLPLTRQSDRDVQRPYPEHARWIHERVVFATLNVPGSDNNFARDRAEHQERDAAVREWIPAAFTTLLHFSCSRASRSSQPLSSSCRRIRGP